MLVRRCSCPTVQHAARTSFPVLPRLPYDPALRHDITTDGASVATYDALRSESRFVDARHDLSLVRSGTSSTASSDSGLRQAGDSEVGPVAGGAQTSDLFRPASEPMDEDAGELQHVSTAGEEGRRGSPGAASDGTSGADANPAGTVSEPSDSLTCTSGVGAELTEMETDDVLGARAGSTRRRNAFGARHYQPHLKICGSHNGAPQNLTELGKRLRVSLDVVRFSYYEVRTSPPAGSSNSR